MCYDVVMRPVLVLVSFATLLGGCPIHSDNGVGDECVVDEDCGSGIVCARDGVCTVASDVREVKVTWTIRGEPANVTTCAGKGDLAIAFHGDGPGESLGYAPVPCFTGQFTVDKLPFAYYYVELGRDGQIGDTERLDTNGMAAFDLNL